MAGLKDDGKWVPQFVPAASGNGEEQIYISKDKSPKMVKLELMGKKLRKAIEMVDPDLFAKCKLSVPSATIPVGWQRIAVVELGQDRDAPPRVGWDTTNLRNLGISPKREEIVSRFRTLAARPQPNSLEFDQEPLPASAL